MEAPDKHITLQGTLFTAMQTCIYMSQAKKIAFCPRICKTRILGHYAPFILSPVDGWITSLGMGANTMNWGGDRRTNGHTI